MAARPRKLVVALAGFASALFLALVALLVFAACTSVPLGPLQPIAKAAIDRRIAPYRIAASTLEAYWNPARLTITVIGEQIDIVDDDGSTLATLPQAEADVALASLAGGTAEVEKIRLVRPSFSVFRAPGGHLSVQLGTADPSQNPERFTKPELNRLADLIACCDVTPFPEISISQGSLTVLNERSGTRVRFGDIELAVRPGEPDNPVEASLALMVGDQRLQFAARVVRGSEQGGFRVLLQPRSVYPAVLGDVLPPGLYLRPFEIPVSGTLGFSIDSQRQVRAIDLDLRGGAGSLEVIEYYGDNLRIESARVRGSIDVLERVVRIDEATIELADGQATLSGTLRLEPKSIALELKARLSNVDLAGLLPNWFAGLPATLYDVPEPGPPSMQTLVAIGGHIRPDAGHVDLAGDIIIRDTPENDDVRRVVFRLSGQSRAPQLLVHSTTP